MSLDNLKNRETAKRLARRKEVIAWFEDENNNLQNCFFKFTKESDIEDAIQLFDFEYLVLCFKECETNKIEQIDYLKKGILEWNLRAGMVSNPFGENFYKIDGNRTVKTNFGKKCNLLLKHTIELLNDERAKILAENQLINENNKIEFRTKTEILRDNLNADFNPNTAKFEEFVNQYDGYFKIAQIERSGITEKEFIKITYLPRIEIQYRASGELYPMHTNLGRMKEYLNKRLIELEHKNKETKTSKIVTNGFYIKSPAQKGYLKDIHNSLIECNYIDKETQLKDFKKLFSNTDASAIKPINWLGSISLLKHLIKLLNIDLPANERNNKIIISFTIKAKVITLIQLKNNKHSVTKDTKNLENIFKSYPRN